MNNNTTLSHYIEQKYIQLLQLTIGVHLTIMFQLSYNYYPPLFVHSLTTAPKSSQTKPQTPQTNSSCTQSKTTQPPQPQRKPEPQQTLTQKPQHTTQHILYQYIYTYQHPQNKTPHHHKNKNKNTQTHTNQKTHKEQSIQTKNPLKQ